MLTFQVTVSCGGIKMYPDCAYCFRNAQNNDAIGCNGNCKINTSNGKCVPKGISRIHYLMIRIEFLASFVITIFPAIM